jgi:hypothetical protein
MCQGLVFVKYFSLFFALDAKYVGGLLSRWFSLFSAINFYECQKKGEEMEVKKIINIHTMYLYVKWFTHV